MTGSAAGWPAARTAGSDEAPRWHRALGYALTGQELDLADEGRPDPASLVAALAEAGWTASRVRAHALGLVNAELAWPHPIPARLRAGCGAAQLSAALGESRRLLGLLALETRPPSARTRLNADELRLMRDVPPHHGS